MKLFNFKLKKLLFFLGERLRVFHQFILRCFHFHINFTIFYVCFHYWLHLFTSLFLQVFLFHHWVYYCFSSVFISPTFFTVALFCQLLCFCAVVPPMLRIWESFFYSKVFFTIHSFRTFGTTCFYQGIPGASICLNYTVFSKRYLPVGSIYVLRTYRTLFQVLSPLF